MKPWVAKAASLQGRKAARNCQLSRSARLTGSELTWMKTTSRQSSTLILDISFFLPLP